MKKFFQCLLILILVVLIGGVGLFFGKGYLSYKDLTQETAVETLVLQVESNEHFVSYEQLPEDLLHATVAIEDRRFYSHGGIDYIGLIRALVSQFDSNLVRSGGSTITQQLAKNLYSKFEFGLDWKATEFYVAKYLEKHYTKDEILTLYVNVINYGNNFTGIYEASMGYFQIEPNQLSIEQCTLLAGIPQSPSNYELFNHYEQAKKKQYFVLQAMSECGYISGDEVDEIYKKD